MSISLKRFHNDYGRGKYVITCSKQIRFSLCLCMSFIDLRLMMLKGPMKR